MFRADAVAHGEALKALCARYGFEGLYLLDNALPKQLAEPREQAAWIYRANIGLIERADAVLANLNFFRGAEPDSGTAFEVGYATALGKPVYGYVDDAGSYAERIRRHARSWSARIRPATATAWPGRVRPAAQPDAGGARQDRRRRRRAGSPATRRAIPRLSPTRPTPGKDFPCAKPCCAVPPRCRGRAFGAENNDENAAREGLWNNRTSTARSTSAAAPT